MYTLFVEVGLLGFFGFFFFLILQEKKVQLKKAQKDEKAVVSGRLYSFPFQQTNWLKPRGETAFFKC